MKIIDVIINCYKLFYNNYPIIVINGLNIDGDIELVQFFFKYYISIIFIYGAMKISDNLEETIDLIFILLNKNLPKYKIVLQLIFHILHQRK